MEKTGPKIRSELEVALKQNDVILLNNQILEVKDFNLVGLGSNWNNEDDAELLNKFQISDKVLVLAHNPDTLSKYPNPDLADFSVFGHTHGGQIKIPWLYKAVLPSKLGLDEGFYQNQYGKFFITSGLGEVGLPMRIFNPPVVDVIELK